MARIGNIQNMWGKGQGANPQRADLWQVDFKAVTDGITQTTGIRLQAIPRYFPATVQLPDLKVNAEVIRRDSTPYNMPSWDAPLDAVQISFHLDDAGLTTALERNVPESLVYKVMDAWRRLVRAGRGGFGAEAEIRLGPDYRIDYAFPIYLYLCKPYPLPAANFATSVALRPNESPAAGFTKVTLGTDFATMVQDTNDEEAVTRRQITEVMADAGQLYRSQMEQGLYISGIYVLEYAWLSSFKLGQLTYQGSPLLTLDAQIYAENILVSKTDPEGATP